MKLVAEDVLCQLQLPSSTLLCSIAAVTHFVQQESVFEVVCVYLYNSQDNGCPVVVQNVCFCRRPVGHVSVWQTLLPLVAGIVTNIFTE